MKGRIGARGLIFAGLLTWLSGLAVAEPWLGSDNERTGPHLLPASNIAFSADGRWDTAAGHWKGGSVQAAPTQLELEGEQDVTDDKPVQDLELDWGTGEGEGVGRLNRGRRELNTATHATKASVGGRGDDGKEPDSPWAGRLRWNVIE